MKKIAFIFFFLSIFIEFGCEVVDPDLAWNSYDYVYNPCNNTYEYLDTRNLYFAPNTGFPFNGYPPNVLLYWRPFSGGFFDCVGLQWHFESLPFTLVSYRYLTNLSTSIETTTKTAKSPTARAYTKVERIDGTEETYYGPAVTFDDIPSGTSQEFQTNIEVSSEGSYYYDYEADPNDEITESNENNNILGDGFSRSNNGGFESSRPSFEIKILTQAELDKILTRYILYKNGQIEVHN